MNMIRGAIKTNRRKKNCCKNDLAFKLEEERANKNRKQQRDKVVYTQFFIRLVVIISQTN